MKKIILIGPLEDKDDPTKKGGGLDVLFLDMIHQFDKYQLIYTVIDANKSNYRNNLVALLTVWYQLITKIRQYDHISLHGSLLHYIFVAPLAVLLAKIFNKTVSLRKFAGNFDILYQNMFFLTRIIVGWSLKNSNANFFETHYLVKYFSHLNKNTFWFPNVRTKPNKIRHGDFQKRFLFVGNITREKGIIELLQASNALDDSYTIHLYGKINPDLSNFDFSPYKATYKHALEHHEVLETMCQYDALILPSYREGYPGVIIEALSVGLPVIATDLPGIKEMVNENCAFFVKAKDVQDIVRAMLQLNCENYSAYSEKSLEAFKQFDSDIQTNKFLEIINATHL
jgi:glycosyltransferase involved in cell wall biosynthesis